MFFDPNGGWRRVSNRDSRTSIDWAEEIRQLLDVDYPQANKVKLLFPTSEKLASELNAWQKERNRTASKVIWHFTTQDARVKLKHLYPLFEDVETDNSNASNKA